MLISNLYSYSDAKTQWGRLRDLYQKARGRQEKKTRSGAGAVADSKWAYYKEMQFLDGYMKALP